MSDARRMGLPTAGVVVSDIRLPSAADAQPTALSSNQAPTVVVILPPRAGTHFRTYLDAHEAGARHLAEWGARLVLVVTGSPGEAEALVPAAFARSHTVLVDPHRKLGVTGPAAMVVDECGAVIFARQVERIDALPTPSELREWVIFVAIRCPECEGPEEDRTKAWAADVPSDIEPDQSPSECPSAPSQACPEAPPRPTRAPESPP